MSGSAETQELQNSKSKPKDYQLSGSGKAWALLAMKEIGSDISAEMANQYLSRFGIDITESDLETAKVHLPTSSFVSREVRTYMRMKDGLKTAEGRTATRKAMAELSRLELLEILDFRNRECTKD